MKKIIKIFLSVLLLATFVCIPCMAASPSYAPYYSYELNKRDQSVSAPVGYVLSGKYDYRSLGLTASFNTPNDIVIRDGKFYILDSGNGRIIETDAAMSSAKVFENFTDSAGQKADITGATGLDIDKNGNFAVADHDRERVLIIGRDGKVISQILRPDAVLQNNDFPFQVSKVKCAENGDIYVTVESMNLGIFVFDENGLFDKFVANNPIVTTADVLLNFFYRSFLSTEQIRNRMQSTPLRVTNFCLDSHGFLYTVSQNADQTEQTGMVRCMNYTDGNIINSSIVFGDLETDRDTDKKTLFQSVAVTEEGNLVLLDVGRGRVFLYSKNGYLITEFGGFGDQAGTFGSPVEVRVSGSDIYVLDAGKNGVFRFSPTDYTKKFTSALKLLGERRFDESLQAWKEVNLLNSNSEYAYYGMGLVYDMKGDYKQAMDCFRLANNREAYSNSFKEYRMQWLSGHVYLIILLVLVLIAAVIGIKAFLKKYRKKADGSAYSAMETKWLFPLYTARHPIDGCEQFRLRDVMSTWLTCGIVLLWLVLEIAAKYATGFVFQSGSHEFNPLAIVFKTVGLYLVFVVSNWCVGSFLEGKGTFKEISTAVSYALLPYVVSRLFVILLSNILVQKEAVFIGIVTAVGLLWTAFLLLASLYAIHQYSFGKTLVSVLLTVIGMIIIVFVLIIFYSLLQQAYGFIQSLYQEITL